MHQPITAFSASSEMFAKESMGAGTVNVEHVYEFIVFRWVFEILHADPSFFMVHFHDHRLDKACEDFEILVLATKDTFCKLYTWSIDRVLIAANTRSVLISYQ